MGKERDDIVRTILASAEIHQTQGNNMVANELINLSNVISMGREQNVHNYLEELKNSSYGLTNSDIPKMKEAVKTFSAGLGVTNMGATHNGDRIVRSNESLSQQDQKIAQSIANYANKNR